MAVPVFHLAPAAPLAERVLLPGDPGRALRLAQLLLDKPRMFNHRRGLWGYTGRAPDGADLTIQSTGMGGPSAAIVVEELVRLGARRLVRVGTAGALDPDLALGDLVVVRAALATDGTSRRLGAAQRVAADAALTARLEAAAPAARAGLVASTDLFYERDPAAPARWRATGALAVEMECAALFALAPALGAAAAAVVAVSDLLEPTRVRIDAEALERAEAALGRVAAAALAAEGS